MKVRRFKYYSTFHHSGRLPHRVQTTKIKWIPLFPPTLPIKMQKFSDRQFVESVASWLIKFLLHLASLVYASSSYNLERSIGKQCFEKNYITFVYFSLSFCITKSESVFQKVCRTLSEGLSMVKESVFLKGLLRVLFLKFQKVIAITKDTEISFRMSKNVLVL